MKRLFQMTCSFKGNNSILILYVPSRLPPCPPLPRPFLCPLSLFPFLISLCQQASPGTPHWGPPRFWSLPRGHLFSLWRLACPWAWAAETRCSFCSGHTALLLFRALLLEGLRRGGTGFPLPSWPCLLPGLQRLFPYLTADPLQLISAFRWTEQPGSGKALQNGN